MSSDRTAPAGRRRAWRTAAVLLAALFAAAAEPAPAVVFHSREAALKLAFPEADRAEARDFFLTAAQRTEIEAAARSKVESDLVTVHVGHRGDELLGYAIFDTHIVRTLPETFLIVIAPDGAIRATHVLAFHEPLDYLPGERWLAQFAGRRAADELRLGRGIDGITGSTLTAQAVSDAIRRALALHAVLLQGR